MTTTSFFPFYSYMLPLTKKWNPVLLPLNLGRSWWLAGTTGYWDFDDRSYEPFSFSLYLLETFTFRALIFYIRNVATLLERPCGKALGLDRGCWPSPTFQLSHSGTNYSRSYLGPSRTVLLPAEYHWVAPAEAGKKNHHSEPCLNAWLTKSWDKLVVKWLSFGILS